MKFRISLGLFVLIAGLAFGLGALPGQAHAAVALSSEDMASMQATLDLTQATLNIVQVQIDRNAIQDPSATIVILGNIQTSLLNMRALLAPAQPSSAVSAIPSPAPAGEVAGSATTEEVATNQQTEASPQPATTVASGDTPSKRAFWIILVTAVIIAIILAIPRKKEEVVALQSAPQDAPQAPLPQAQSSERTEPAQSA